ncbi:Prophage antirepressor [Chromobacterium vaccinii]|nr:Prophage antirepressor [Chromobacterium vaccinii]QND90813.1 Prophage antirepressor [Chromobacterium vaccinii]
MTLKLRGFRGNGTLLVSESGLYALIMRSNKPAAKKFRRWVTSEVLPTIRKEGMYVSEAAAEQAIESPELTVSAKTNQPQPLTRSEARTLSMSSREIAELVESRHDKVKQSIERLVERGVIAQPPMGEMPARVANGRTYYETVYHVGKRDSYVVVAQLCPEFTARLVDRWQELEEQVRQPAAPSFQIPQTFEDALILAGQEMKQRKQLEALSGMPLN